MCSLLSHLLGFAIVALLVNHGLSNVVTSVQIKTCTAYKAINSANTEKRYCSCYVTVCANQYLTVDSCGMCTGDPQFLRIYSTKNNTRLVDGYGGYGVSSCAPCARVDNFRPADYNITTGCETFTIREGCFGNGQCSATVKLYLSNVSIPSNFSYTSITPAPTISPTTSPSLLLSSLSSQSNIFSFQRLLTGIDLSSYVQDVWEFLSNEDTDGDGMNSIDLGAVQISTDSTASIDWDLDSSVESNRNEAAVKENPIPVHSMRRRRGRTYSSSSSETPTAEDEEYQGYCGYKRRLNAGVIAGIAIGASAGAIAIAFVAFLCVRWKNSHDAIVVPAGYQGKIHVTAKDEWLAEEKL